MEMSELPQDTPDVEKGTVARDTVPVGDNAVAAPDTPAMDDANETDDQGGIGLQQVISNGHMTRTVTPVPYTIYNNHQKSFLVAMVSIAATFSGLSGNIYFPAIPQISRNLHVSNEAVTLTVTTYMIFQGLSPSFWGALSDTRGRRIAYISTFIVYIGACIGLAETKHYYQLVILRCLQSTGSASTIAIGAGVLGDITTREERGGYMGIYNAGLLFPVAIGPVIGGAFAETLGWRAIFWFLMIYAAVFFIFLVILLPETLRSLVGNGSIPPKGLAKSPFYSFVQQRRRRQYLKENPNDEGATANDLVRTDTLTKPKKAQLNPLTSLVILFNKEVTFVIIFLSIYYTVWQMVIASMSTLFERTYGLTSFQSGLCFIANGVGCVLGTYFTGKFLDWDYARVQQKFLELQNKSPTPLDFPIEHARLRSAWLYSLISITSVLIFGWTVSAHVHIAAPIVFVFALGWSSTSLQGVITTLMVDLFHTQSASATATVNLARCLLGAGGTAAVLPIIDGIGVGWTFTLCAGILVGALVFLAVQIRYGPRWRAERKRREKDAAVVGGGGG